MNVLYVFSDKVDNANCSVHNCFRPADAINKLPGHKAVLMPIDQFTLNQKDTRDIVEAMDIIVVERNLFNDALTVMQYWKSRNKSVMTIFDDAYDLIEPTNTAYGYWTNGEIKVKITNDKGDEKETTGYMNPKPLDMLVWGLEMSKGLQCPSRQLAEDWSKFTDTYYIPNYIVAENYLNVEPLYPHDDIIIGWGGSLSHMSSFMKSKVLMALRRVVRKYDNVRIMITGDKRIFDAVDVRAGKKIYYPFVPPEQFLPLMKSFDIAIAPLHGEFDKRRSRIKILEFMALQTPWVASEFPTYEDFTGLGLMTNNTAEDWEEKLCYTIDHLDERREFAKGEPFEYAMSQSYDNNIQKTLDLYQSIIKKPYLGYYNPRNK